ncbi:hypothetical protein [Pseudoalteromonas sp. SWYJZ19]|uniref:hypothetical protein n=1 Tax=Pseudoalteromonas sp. SWYJZ19 TaxID=2792068 RepID=UPI0018CCB2D2|nr:hypothetical protein [Pseudoalteromonas sp. SWYJZ19]MBH0050676.1 hypothetical protein [Pseudoalteromonas sp. SWYJZ19]
MLTSAQKIQVRNLVNYSLDKAENHWKNGAYQLFEGRSISFESYNKSMDSEPSKIPGHSVVHDDVTVIDEFIAYVADMRDSSKHLMCEISAKNSKVSRLQRVFYETSALLPALALTINFNNGKVTEYLGDGVLALFKVDPEDKSKAIYAAHEAAKNAVGQTRDIVNEILEERYSLPKIDLGVGLAMSKALITLVGLEGEKHPKAFGECVFRATKLSGGRNQIITDEIVKSTWPTVKGGTLVFRQKRIKEISGYLIM